MTVLVTIAPDHALNPAAAAAWSRAVAAGCPVTITSSYRSPERQAEMRAEYLVALASWRRNPVGKKPTYVAAVQDSEHVEGNALDLQDPAIAWMRAHPDYGFVFTDPTERWHVAYRLSADRHLTHPTPPTPLDPQEDDMYEQADRELAERTDVKAQTAMQAADNATNAANAATAAARDAEAAAKAARDDIGTVANELRALARALGHPVN